MQHSIHYAYETWKESMQKNNSVNWKSIDLYETEFSTNLTSLFFQYTYLKYFARSNK